MADSHHQKILELLTILASEPMPSQGFETQESEFERNQKHWHEALCRLSQQQGHPAIFQMYAHINDEMPPDGGSRDENIRAARKFARLLLPVFLKVRSEEARITNYAIYLREAATRDPFLEGASLTRDAYAGQGEPEPEEIVQFDERGNVRR